MTDLLFSPRLRLGGADKGIRDLEGALKAYTESQPYAQIVEYDTKAGLDVHKITLTKELDPQRSLEVVKIAEDLRAALDHTGFAMARAAGAPIVATSTYFPFAPRAEKLDEVVKGRCKNIPPDIVALFRAFQPYKGGDDLLWSINELANTGKHRVIHPVGRVVNAQSLHSGYFEHIAEMSMPPKWDDTKNEIVLFTCRRGAKAEYQMSLGIPIVFGDVGVLRRHEVLGGLNAMARKVEGIIDATEARAKQIGLI